MRKVILPLLKGVNVEKVDDGNNLRVFVRQNWKLFRNINYSCH